MQNEVATLLTAESVQLGKLQLIVKKSIKDQNLVLENLLNPLKEILTQG